jgi:hypothetical protein
MSLGLPRIASLRGEKKPFAAGRMVDACRSFPTSICNFFKGTVFYRSMTWISLMYVEALAGGRSTVRLTSSNMNLIISFLVVKFPSPAASFLAEIGSLPSLCFVTNMGGKTAWMPWIAALQMVGMCAPSSDWVAAHQKSSTYTWRSLVGDRVLPRIGTSAIFMASSRGSGRSGMSLSKKCCIRSLADSVTAHKWDGLSTQPIWTAGGTTTQHGSPASWGRTYANL